MNKEDSNLQDFTSKYQLLAKIHLHVFNRHGGGRSQLIVLQSLSHTLAVVTELQGRLCQAGLQVFKDGYGGDDNNIL